MKIVLANNYLYLRGGSERVLFDEMSWLRANGHEAWVFGRSRGSEPLLRHSNLFPRVAQYSTATGIRRLRVALETVYNRSTGARFVEYCGRAAPELVHFHNIYAGLTTSVIDVSRKLDLPSVLTLHDYKLACPS